MLFMAVALAAPLELKGQGVSSSCRSQQNNEASVPSTPGACVFCIGVVARSQVRLQELKSFLALACSASIADSFSHFNPPSPETNPSRAEGTQPTSLVAL